MQPQRKSEETRSNRPVWKMTGGELPEVLPDELPDDDTMAAMVVINGRKVEVAPGSNPADEESAAQLLNTAFNVMRQDRIPECLYYLDLILTQHPKTVAASDAAQLLNMGVSTRKAIKKQVAKETKQLRATISNQRKVIAISAVLSMFLMVALIARSPSTPAPDTSQRGGRRDVPVARDAPANVKLKPQQTVRTRKRRDVPVDHSR